MHVHQVDVQEVVAVAMGVDPVDRVVDHRVGVRVVLIRREAERRAQVVKLVELAPRTLNRHVSPVGRHGDRGMPAAASARGSEIASGSSVRKSSSGSMTGMRAFAGMTGRRSSASRTGARATRALGGVREAPREDHALLGERVETWRVARR